MSEHNEHEKVEIPQTPEGIAYKLMLDIFKVEKKSFVPHVNLTLLTKEEILTTYAECLKIVVKAENSPTDADVNAAMHQAIL